MKKVLSLVLVMTMVLTSFTFAFGSTDTAKYDALVESGLFGQGGLRLDESFTRAQFALVALRAEGYTDEEAKAAGVAADFADVPASHFYFNYIGLAQELELVKGDGTNFNPDEIPSYRQVVAVLLRILGEDAAVDAGYANGNMMDAAAELGFNVTSVDPLAPANRGVIADLLVNFLEITTEEELEVVSVSANSAKSFQVTFNRAVTAEDVVSFDATRGTSAITLTSAWNEDNTVVTLTSASNFAETTYTVAVKSDGNEIAKEDIVITAQKVGKIEFTSNTVAVKTQAPGEGFVTYKVYDQYNNDITTSYLANNIQFQSGAVPAGNVVGRDGLVTLTPGGSNPLIQFPNISIVAFDQTSGVTSTVTLPTAAAVGTLSDFQFGSVESLELVEGDYTSRYYIPFTAKDLSGNETKDFSLVKGGLILEQGTDRLVVSLPNYVRAKVVEDPNNSKLAAIEVTVLNGGTLVMDMPVTITAMTYTGKTSSVQTSVAKSKAVNNVVLLAPTEVVAAGETPEIKFEAFDQYGNRVTKFSDIDGKVNPTGFTISPKVDGSAKFTMTAVGTKGIASLSASVPATGKFSSLNINVQDAAVPARITVDNSKLVVAMEDGATQKIGLVDTDDNFIKVYDQYDRVMSKTKINDSFGTTANKYYVKASNLTNDVTVDTSTTANLVAANSDITLAANNVAGGADTIKFELIRINAAAPLETVLNTATTSLSVVKTSDITDYTVEVAQKDIYAATAVATAATAQQEEFAAKPKVYGKTTSGTKVLLEGTPVIGASVTNGTDFVVPTDFSSAVAFDGVKVVARKMADSTRTSAESTVTLNILHNSKVTALTTNVKSTTVAPVAKDIIVKGTNSDDIVTVTGTAVENKFVLRYNPTSGASQKDDLAPFHFRVEDSYATNGMNFAQIIVVRESDAGTLTIATTGEITTATAGTYKVSAVTTNGLVKTIRVIVQ